MAMETISDSSPLGPSESSRQFVGVLRSEGGSGPGDMVRLDASELVIGSAPESGLALRDDSVSGRHARICRIEDQFILEDLGSTSGTYVDGVPIVSCVLRPGDWIQIGRRLFRFDRFMSSGDESKGPKAWLG